MEKKVKTKFKLGDQFLFKAGSWTYKRECYGDKARINSITILITDDDESPEVKYGMEVENKIWGTWDEMFSAGCGKRFVNEKELDEGGQYFDFKKIDGVAYEGDEILLDIKYELGETLISSVNGTYKNGLPNICNFCGDIFKLDLIKYKKSLAIRQRVNSENNMERENILKDDGLWYCWRDNSSLIYDGFCGRINNGENCRWLNSGDSFRFSCIGSLKYIDLDRYIDEVVKFFKKEKIDRLIPPEENIGEYEVTGSHNSNYYMFFKALGKEKELVDTYNSYKTVVVKKTKPTKKKSKVSEIADNLSDKEKQKLLKLLLKDAKK